ncbi:hypothetical protein PG995_011621 [Apiospora arundinis]
MSLRVAVHGGEAGDAQRPVVFGGGFGEALVYISSKLVEQSTLRSIWASATNTGMPYRRSPSSLGSKHEL